MRLLKRDGGRYIFRFERPEREMFARILEMYPKQEKALRSISDEVDAQKLLEKALREQRSMLREESEKLLRTNGELVIDGDFNEFWDLALSEGEIEWLLQMFNDVRIGFWNDIGRPNPSHDIKMEGTPSDDFVRAHVIMQLCATWQSILMQAVDADEVAPPD